MSPKPECPPVRDSRYPWLWGVLIALLVFLALAQALSICSLFPSPVELTYPNSVMVYVAREVQHGRPIYRDFRQPPYILALYGPLSYALPGLAGRLCNADEVGLFKIGRGLSLLWTGGSFVVLGWLLRRRERVSWRMTAIALLVFATARVVWPVSMCPRPDAAELFFVLLGLAIFLKAEATPWRYAAVLPLVAAFLFKQSALVAPAAIVLYLLVQRRVRIAATFALVTAAAYTAAFWTVNTLTDGLYFLNNFTALRANHTLRNLLTIDVELVLIPCAVPLVPAALGVWRRWRAREVDLYAVFFVVTTLVACAGTIRDGAADNYFLTAVALACVIGGVELQRLLTVQTAPAPAAARASRAIQTVLLISIAFFALHTYVAAGFVRALAKAWPTSAREGQRHVQYLQDVAEQLNSRDGAIISTYDPLTLYCRRPLMMDTLTLSGLADRGVLDDSGIVDAIRQHRVAAVVLRFPLKAGFVPQHQSTDVVPRAWLQAALDAGYTTTSDEPLYFYFPPPEGP